MLAVGLKIPARPQLPSCTVPRGCDLTRFTQRNLSATVSSKPTLNLAHTRIKCWKRLVRQGRPELVCDKLHVQPASEQSNTVRHYYTDGRIRKMFAPRKNDSFSLQRWIEGSVQVAKPTLCTTTEATQSNAVRQIITRRWQSHFDRSSSWILVCNWHRPSNNSHSSLSQHFRATCLVAIHESMATEQPCSCPWLHTDPSMVHELQFYIWHTGIQYFCMLFCVLCPALLSCVRPFVHSRDPWAQRRIY